MPATLTQTILTVDGIHSPMLQAGPPQAEEAVVFVHGNPGSSQDWARLAERTGDQPGTALDAARPRPRPARQGDSAQRARTGAPPCR